MGTESDHEQRIATLEMKVSDLYKALRRGEPTGKTSVSPEVQALLADGNALEALKIHQQQSGLGLGEARAAIEEYQSQGG